MSINLCRAAKYFKNLPHQIAAFNFLESKIPDDVLDEFADIYRAAPANPKTVLLHLCNEPTDWLSR